MGISLLSPFICVSCDLLLCTLMVTAQRYRGSGHRRHRDKRAQRGYSHAHCHTSWLAPRTATASWLKYITRQNTHHTTVRWAVVATLSAPHYKYPSTQYALTVIEWLSHSTMEPNVSLYHSWTMSHACTISHSNACSPCLEWSLLAPPPSTSTTSTLPQCPLLLLFHNRSAPPSVK